MDRIDILLATTFVFGVIHLLTFTKLFKEPIHFITNAIIPHKENSNFGAVLRVIGVWFFYFSLIFQAWYWIFDGRTNFN